MQNSGFIKCVSEKHPKTESSCKHLFLLRDFPELQNLTWETRASFPLRGMEVGWKWSPHGVCVFRPSGPEGVTRSNLSPQTTSTGVEKRQMGLRGGNTIAQWPRIWTLEAKLWLATSLPYWPSSLAVIFLCAHGVSFSFSNQHSLS